MISTAYGSRTNYGQAIGILMLDTKFPRIPGDVGNASTFSFPVRYKIVKGASPQRVIDEADPSLIQPFITAARELENEGVRAITTSCGFMAIFHQELVESVDVPVFSSSLLQVHFARTIINKTKKIGILTARARALTERHLRGVGIQDIPLAIMGMDGAEEFTTAFFGARGSLEVEKCREEMIATAQKLVRSHPQVGALVLECTNMPPFSKAIQSAVNLPVFDVVTMINYVYSAVVRKEYDGFM